MQGMQLLMGLVTVSSLLPHMNRLPPSLPGPDYSLLLPSRQSTYLQVRKEDSPVRVGCREVVPLASQHISGCCTRHRRGREQASVCHGVVLLEPAGTSPVLTSCRASALRACCGVGRRNGKGFKWWRGGLQAWLQGKMWQETKRQTEWTAGLT